MFKNERLPLPFALTAIAVIAFSGPAAADEQEIRDLSGFDAIDVGSGIALNVRPGDEFLVEVIADSGELLEGVVTEVDGHTLRIRQESTGNSLFNWWGGDSVVNVTLPALRGLEASGNSDINGEGTFTGDQLRIQASGSSDVILEVAVERLEVETSGGSDVRLSGKTGVVQLVSSGGSDLDAEDLEAMEADLRCSGGSDVSITVLDRLVVNASGGSDVNYSGSPNDVDVNASSGADVRRR